MTKRVVVFENLQGDLHKLQQRLESAGCEVLAFSHCCTEKVRDDIRYFDPDLAIVDSHFDDDIDGMAIITDLSDICPRVAFVVCSILLNDPSKRSWLSEQYARIDRGVRLIPKKPFPTAVALLSGCSIK